MNFQEKTAEVNLEKKLNVEGALMKVKIQRMEKEDFFVSISGKRLITHLKEKIIAFLAAQLENDDISLCVGNLRLIYKGKVLLDPKPVEFYKIQNDDTIQLCPRRQRRLGQSSMNPAGSPNETTDTQDWDAIPDFVGEPTEFSLLSFAMSEPFELRGVGSNSIQLPRIRNRGQRALNNFEPSIHAPPLRLGPRRRLSAPARNRATPATVTGTMRNFKFVLQDTLRRVSTSNVDNRQELIPQLDVLIRHATRLRADLQMESPVSAPFRNRFEVMLLERMGIPHRSNFNSREEKEDVPRAHRVSEPLISNPMVWQPEWETGQRGSFNFDAERRGSSTERFGPHRFNAGSAFELSLAGSRFGENRVNPLASMPAPVAAEANIRENQSSTTHNDEEITPPDRNGRSRNMFSRLINRIGRR